MVYEIYFNKTLAKLRKSSNRKQRIEKQKLINESI